MPEPDPPPPEPDDASSVGMRPRKPLFACDRCGSDMYEQNCKIICPNCGNRFDCSDLTLNFD